MAIAIVGGALANRPGNGGGAWVRLSYVHGLRRLGFDPYFVEELERTDDASIRYFDSVIAQSGLSGKAALIVGAEDVRGLEHSELLEVAGAAEFLLNISGHLTWEPLMRRVARRIYLDLDPGFTQFWRASGVSSARLEGHDVYFTIGENIGDRVCPIPMVGIDWLSTRPPVVLDDWPVSANGDRGLVTTVGSWRGPYGPVEWKGKRYGLKVHEFRKVIELPERAPQSFELAFDIHPADSRDGVLLERHGWRLVDPKEVAFDPDSFRRYVQRSGAEFSASQGVYVETESGWISDRTVRYLASGKPALVQETGFSRNVPTGEGLLSYRTLDEAVAGAEAIASDYARHAQAARALAAEHFGSDEILGRLLDEAHV